MDHTTLIAAFPNRLVGLRAAQRWTPVQDNASEQGERSSQSFDGAATWRCPDTMLG